MFHHQQILPELLAFFLSLLEPTENRICVTTGSGTKTLMLKANINQTLTMMFHQEIEIQFKISFNSKLQFHLLVGPSMIMNIIYMSLEVPSMHSLAHFHVKNSKLTT